MIIKIEALHQDLSCLKRFSVDVKIICDNMYYCNIFEMVIRIKMIYVLIELLYCLLCHGYPTNYSKMDLSAKQKFM